MIIIIVMIIIVIIITVVVVVQFDDNRVVSHEPAVLPDGPAAVSHRDRKL